MMKRIMLKITLWMIYGVFALIILLIMTLLGLCTSDQGSQWLLQQIMQRQSFASYQYIQGNVWQGLQLKNIQIKVKQIEVDISHATVKPSWNTLWNRALFFSDVQAETVIVLNYAPANHEPFKFPRVHLPFILSIQQAAIKKLEIHQVQSAVKVDFNDIHIKQAIWQETTIQVQQAALNMGFIAAKNVKGFIQLDQQYPIQAQADIDLPALHPLHLEQLHAKVTGNLDSLLVQAQPVIQHQPTQHILAVATIHPVRQHVPMQGQLTWKNWQLPFLPSQQLYSKSGTVDISGDIQQLNIEVNTELSGKYLPFGQYQAKLNTNLKQLNVEQFNVNILNGTIDVTGWLNWQKGLTWNIFSINHGLNLKQVNHLVPQAILDFLPKENAASIQSQGQFIHHQLILDNHVQFKQAEQWNIHLNQAAEHAPLNIKTTWKQINRPLPYLKWLNSPFGVMNIQLDKNEPSITGQFDILPHEHNLLPIGNYHTTFNLKNHILNIEQFNFKQNNRSQQNKTNKQNQTQNQQGQLSVQGKLYLPNHHQQLAWQLQLNSQHINPNQLHTSIPLEKLDGNVTIQGYQKNNQYITNLKNIQLTGQLLKQNEQLILKGQSTFVAIMNHEQDKTGLKSFALLYDGLFLPRNQQNQNYYELAKGQIKLNISGTPQLLRINQLHHQGIAGEIDLSGQLDLTQGIKWQIHTELAHFKPQYLMATLDGDLTGQLHTTGEWSAQNKSVQVKQLNISGELNKKPILAQGDLNINIEKFLKNKTSFQSQQLFIRYANNQITAQGDEHGLNIAIQAKHLNELTDKLTGNIQGTTHIQLNPDLNISADIQAQHIIWDNTFHVEHVDIKGTLPLNQTPSRMLININQLKSGERGIDHAQFDFAGTQQAHVLKISADNRLSQFLVSLAGGIQHNGDWLGQIQQGLFQSQRVSLQQNQAANVYYQAAKQTLNISAHCWQRVNTADNVKIQDQEQICLEKQAQISKTQGKVGVLAQHIKLANFAQFLPEGFSVEGILDGFAHLAWQQGQAMQFDAQMQSQKGSIGLASDDEDMPPTTLAYNKILLTAKTQPDGLHLQMSADTPVLGTGWLNILIGQQEHEKSLSGSVALDGLKLALLKPFIRDVRTLDGQLSAAGHFSGTLNQPEFLGEVRLTDGQLAMLSTPINLKNIQVAAAIRGSQAAILGGFNAGRGMARITGRANWINTPSIRLNVTGEDLVISQPPTLSAMISPDVIIDVKPTLKQLNVKGKIDIPLALINMPESSGKPVVTVSPDVRIVRAGVVDAIKSTKPWNIRADIGVNLGEHILFRGFNAEIPLLGRLNLTQRGTAIALQANGAIGAARAVKIEAYGQTLDLNQAIARFDGALTAPILDVDASKNVQGSTIGVNVTGVATHPSVKVYNDAGLTEQEALNALLTGRISNSTGTVSNTEGFKTDVGNTITAAGISMGLGGTRAMTNQIGRAFGLSGLALDAQGAGNDTQVSVTGYITPDLYIRYGIGIFTPVSKLTLRYQMNRRLYVEASSSLERAVDIFYHWKF